MTTVQPNPGRELARLRAELNDTRHRLATVLGSAPLMLLSIDRQGTVTRIEGQGLAVNDVDPAAVVGSNVFAVLGENHDAAQKLRCALQGEPQQGQLQSRRGHEWEYRLTPVRDARGAVTGVTASAFDVTERRRSELAMRESAAKSRFLAAMSHELRTPLNSILGFNQLLDAESGGELTDKQRRYVRYIDISGRQLLSLINEVLDLSKVAAGELVMEVAEVDMAMIAAVTADSVRPLVEARDQVLEVAVPVGLVVRADPRRLAQALTNLIANAIKFSPEGGRITVCARPAGEYAELAVVDNGIGIAEEDQGLVFDEFTQLEAGRHAGGTGLGLALTRQLVEAMGGSIRLRSRLGAGSTFTIALPAVLRTSEGCW